jgi:FKBP-type peptidyl-prolyl cis-trans isomerase (trigger factor)
VDVSLPILSTSIAEGVVGQRAGEEFATEVTFPADYAFEKLNNKTSQFAIWLKQGILTYYYYYYI